MKNNGLFSLVLCIGLLLPVTNFGSERWNAWYNWAKRGAETAYGYLQWPNLSAWATNLVNRLSEGQKYALFAALLAAFGYSYYSPQEKLGFTPVAKSPYAATNLRNIAIFLSHIEQSYERMFLKAVWTGLSQKTDWNAANIKLFEDHVYLILFRIIIPSPIPAQTWIALIKLVKQQNTDLLKDDLDYLEILKYYLNACQNCTNKEGLQATLQAAINFMTSKKNEQLKAIY